MEIIKSRHIVVISYSSWLLIRSQKLVASNPLHEVVYERKALIYERKANHVPASQQTNFRSHARLATSTEKFFPQCMFGRLVLNQLKSHGTNAMLH